MKYGYLKVASAVPKIEIADCHYNTSQIENFMAKAEGLGAEIIVFPELCVTGYSCQDLFQQQLLLEKAEASLLRLMEFSRNLKIVTIIGVPLSHKGRLFNLAAVCNTASSTVLFPRPICRITKNSMSSAGSPPAQTSARAKPSSSAAKTSPSAPASSFRFPI